MTCNGDAKGGEFVFIFSFGIVRLHGTRLIFPFFGRTELLRNVFRRTQQDNILPSRFSTGYGYWGTGAVWECFKRLVSVLHYFIRFFWYAVRTPPSWAEILAKLETVRIPSGWIWSNERLWVGIFQAAKDRLYLEYDVPDRQRKLDFIVAVGASCNISTSRVGTAWKYSPCLKMSQNGFYASVQKLGGSYKTQKVLYLANLIVLFYM